MVKKTTKKKKGKSSAPKKMIVSLVGILVVVAAVYFGLQYLPQGTAVGFQKGMGYVSWSNEGYLSEGSDASLAKVKETGTEYVSVLTTWYQTNCWSGDIHKTEKTPTDESVIHAIRKSHELGMKVMLKLHLDLLDKSDGSWRGEIGCLKEEDWDNWFENYEKFIMYYVDMANKENVEMICIGTELSTTATVKGYLWSGLIDRIRAKYPGKLVYAAHWDRYQDIRFWDKLDFVGINAYFPLSKEMNPSLEELKKGWVKWVDEIEDFQKKVEKPIIFPECGCNAADGAAIRPWEHLPRTEVNLSLQADYYTALLETFWEKEWFYGLYWWYWGTNVRMGGKYNRGFTPQNKPAEKVIEEWYAKPVVRRPEESK